ncbi:chromate efflux transporter [Pedobacter sp.]|uniref:chromate efflux transporter n=1 Tax=Pedobacter sp. TaxID=1411316 RepID=UPI00396CA54C
MGNKRLLFLRNVLLFTFTSFGGAQAHIALLLRYFVTNVKFINEDELLELNALSQVLPGPASTQTLVGIAYKVGGLSLAILTFLIWILPSAAIMTFVGISYSMLDQKRKFIDILEYVHPIALGIVAYGAYQLGKKVLTDQVTFFLAFGALVSTLILREAYVFPLAILIGGMISSAIATPQEETQVRVKLFSNINPKKLGYFVSVLLIMAILGGIINRTSPFSLPIRLFENFYRNGIFIFGGGQVLVPMLYTEFVQMKHYVSQTDFLSGFAFQQVLPGPTFSFTSYVGTLSMKHGGYGFNGQLIGGLLAVLGINLPGLILVLFIVPFWDDLKKIASIKYSLSGVNAVTVGFIAAAFIMLAIPMKTNVLFIAIMFCSFMLLNFTKINPTILVLVGIIMGYLI